MGMMTLDVRLSGRGRTERMKGRIVGFSNRLNTILVPQAFMEWANATLGDGGQTALTTDCGGGQSGGRPHREVFQAERL